jgi:hypothetical protein
MLDKSKPMTLGDIFNNAFVLIKDTFVRNIIIAVLFLIPAGILMAYGMKSYFNVVFNMAEIVKLKGAENINQVQIGNIFLSLIFFFFSLVIFSLAYLGAWIGIIKGGCSSIEGTKINLSDALIEIFSKTLLRCVGQILLIALAGIIFVIIIIAVLMAGQNALLTLFTVLFIFAGIGFALFLWVRWYFAPLNIVYMHDGVSNSFIRSWNLVKDYWWRTFGIMLLISIIVGFASTIISTPITFIFEWDFIVQYFKLIMGGNSGANDPVVMLGLMRSLGFTYGLIIAFSSTIHMLVFPLFQIVIYFDLKIRKNEFSLEMKPENEPLFEDPVI